MADEQIRIDITAEDDASKVIDDVADDAERLEKLTPEVAVTADVDDAQRGIRDATVPRHRRGRAQQDLGVLTPGLGVVDLGSRPCATTSSRRQLDKVGGSGGGGTGPRAQAIADLTGPLGDVSGQASDLGGVFDGLDDIFGGVAGKIGIDAAKMSTAIGGIGLAVVAATTLWSLYTDAQRKARERQRELVEGQREINEALREGDLDAAGRKFIELYKGPLQFGRELGGTTKQITDYLTGQSEALQTNIDRWKEKGGNEAILAGELESQRAKYQATNGTLQEQDAQLRAVTQALGETRQESDKAGDAQGRLERQTDRVRDAFDRLRGNLSFDRAFQAFEQAMSDALTATDGEVAATEEEILSLKEAILEVAEFAKLTPVQVASLLQRVEQGDLAGVAADVARYYQNNQVPIATSLQDPQNVAEVRRRMIDALGEIPIRGVLTTVRSGNVNVPV